jgi:esterase/lipase
MYSTNTGSFLSHDNVFVKYKLYDAKNPKCIILGVHGGCFQDGDENWNKEQSEDLANNNISVIHVGFRQDSTEQSLQDLIYAYHFLKTKYEYTNLPVGVLGSSSGGFFSIALANNYQHNIKFDFSIHLCPVSKPFQRYKYLQTSDHPHKTSMLEKHLKHFKDERTMRTHGKLTNIKEVHAPMLVITGTKDKNVPVSINKHLMVNKKITCIMLDSGHEICYKRCEFVIDLIDRFLDSVSNST